MIGTTTYQRLLAAEGAARSPQRARTAARATWAALLEIAEHDRPDLQIAKSTLLERRRSLVSAGVAPMTDAFTLAVLASDLGKTDTIHLVRLLWVLNADRQGRLDRVAERYAVMILEAEVWIEGLKRARTLTAA